MTSYKELQQTQHIESHTHVVSFRRNSCGAQLGSVDWLDGRGPCVALSSATEIEGEVDILDIDYLIKEIVPELPKHRAEDSIFDYLENDLGLAISYAQKEITVEPLTEMDKQLIGEVEGNHVVVVRSIMNLEDTRCFGYTESRHRLNKFKFVEFARRRKL